MNIARISIQLVILFISILIFPASVLAQSVITGLSVSVAGDDTVTVSNTGTSAYPNGVGTPAGTYTYKNGWSWVSGSIQWTDTNNNNVLRMDSTGIIVQISNGVANANGSKSGSVQLAGNTTLGAALRAAHGVGNNIAFSSNVASSSVDFMVSGTVTIAPPAYDVDLSVTKDDGATTSVAGTQTTYTIVAANAGPDPDPDVSLTDTFPAALNCSFTSVAAGGATGNTANGSGNLSESLSLPVGASVTYTVVCDIDSAATGTLINTANISSPGVDSDTGNNSATDETAVEQEADLSITKTDGVIEATAGESTLTYVIVASNAGPSDVTDASISDTFPANLSCGYSAASTGTNLASGFTAGPVAADADIADTNVTMPADSAITYTATCEVPADHAEETLSNTATIASAVDDPDLEDRLATDDDTVVIRVSNLETTKIASSDPLVAQGSELTYTITVTNNGPSDAENVQFVDNLPAGFSYVSNDGGCDTSLLPQVTCNLGTIANGNSGAVNIVGTVIADLGSFLSNTATASSDSAAGSAGEESDTVRSEVVVGVPSDGTAIVGVRKVFNDGNNETPVTVTLECLSGTYAPDFAILQPGGDMQHLFVVDAIPSGTANPCTVVEAPVDGYSPYYICEPDDSTSEVDGTLCESFEKPKAVAEKFGIGMLGNDTTACGWIDVQPGDSNVCYILNVPDPVDVDVTKVWDLTAAGRNDVDTDVRLTLNCDARIKDGDPHSATVDGFVPSGSVTVTTRMKMAMTRALV